MTYEKRLYGWTAVACLALASVTQAQKTANRSITPRKPSGIILLELFTSEGCSSCPPADELLRQMNGMRTPEGDVIVAISEHVTYWNQLGWRDRFSSEAYTERQKAYGDRFRLTEVYTPQMVINGEAAVVGSDKRALLKGLMDAHPAKASGLHILSAANRDGKVAFTYSYTPAAAPQQLFAVVAEDQASSDVLRGENKGRTLHHVAVATVFKKLEAVGGETQTAEFPLAEIAGSLPGKRHLILFAQAGRLGPVVSVDTIAF